MGLWQWRKILLLNSSPRPSLQFRMQWRQYLWSTNKERNWSIWDMSQNTENKFGFCKNYRVTQKKLYLFCGSQGEHGCFQNSEINIFLDYQWQIWLFPTNTFIDFLVRKMIFVIAQNLAQLSNYKYLFLKLFWDTQ